MNKYSIYLKKITYFFSKWIANLGVDPLFLSCALRRLPMFLRLFARRISVIFVFDTIKILPKSLIPSFLPCLCLIVKNDKSRNPIFLWIFIIHFIHFLPISKAKVPDKQPNQVENIVLSIGEHYELKLPLKANFAVGNKEIIATKILENRKILLIKGKRIGHTDILIWHGNRQANTVQHQVFVISKREQLKISQISTQLQNMGLKTNLQGPPFLITGDLKLIEDYRHLIKINQRFKNDLLINVSLSISLKQQLLAMVYEKFLNQFLDSIECHFENIKLSCRYPTDDIPSKELLESMHEEWGIEFSPTLLAHATNYIAKLKIIQIEASSIDDINWGLSEIKQTWGEWFGPNPFNLLKQKTINLSARDVEFRVLAEPEIILRADQDIKIQVGQENSIQIPDSNAQRGGIEWKFSGLQVKLRAKKRGALLELEFETGLTRPDGDGSGQLSSSSEKSTALVAFGRPLPLFDITIESHGQDTRKLPWFHRIPILGYFFKGKSKAYGHKKITGVIVINKGPLYDDRP